jgi:hypothetical protein
VSPVIAKSEVAGSNILRFVSTGDALFTLTLSPSTGGQITGVYPAAVFSESVNFSAFFDPANFSCTGLNVSQLCSVGQVGLVPNATITGGVKPFSFTIPRVTTRNYQGLWWNSPDFSESGWGLNLAHQGDVIFATWFTYDADGKAWWLTMTAEKTADAVYGGTLYETNGPVFNAVPFNSPPVTHRAVGTGVLSFASATLGTFAYTVNGIAQTKTIIPQAFATVPTCTWSAQADLTAATNYQDLWWAAPAESESGWGINFTHQGTTIFATWFTYDVNNKPLWYSVTAFQTAPKTFAGALYRTIGPAFSAVPFDPAKVTRTEIGSATLTFTNGNAGSFDYKVNDGANVGARTKAITRQIFRPAGTICQ